MYVESNYTVFVLHGQIHGKYVYKRGSACIDDNRSSNFFDSQSRRKSITLRQMSFFPFPHVSIFILPLGMMSTLRPIIIYTRTYYTRMLFVIILAECNVSKLC